MIGSGALLQTILECPEADAPRLVCADWLEEQGNPLAELIRVQCELARIGESHPRRERLHSREQELIARNEATWLEPIRRLGFSSRWRRGFLEVSISGVQVFLEAADRLARMPWVLHIHLRDAAAGLADVAELAKSSHFACVQRIDLSRSRIGNDGVRMLTESRCSPQPTHLMLNSVGLTSTGLRMLIENLSLNRLVQMQLQGNGVGPAGARALSLTPRFTRLRVLDFSYNRLGTVGGEYLAESLYLGQLQSLIVVGNSIGGRGKKALHRRFGKRVRLVSNETFV
jgi:uncharacterized protein (TIGR02996 family)